MKSSRPVLFLFALLAAGFLTGCDSSPPPDTFPGQPVTQRNRLFKGMLRSVEPIGLMARGKQKFDALAAQGHATELHRLAREPWSHFPPGSDYKPSKAKPAIWEKPAEFKQAQEALLRNTDRLLDAARARDEAAVKAAYEATYQACSGCHKAFRR